MRRKLAQLDSMKQGFLASVSHELRTPLSKIREALSLLNDGVLGSPDARQARVLEIAQQACERQIRMVSTLLDLSRMRSGSQLQPIDSSAVDTVIERALQDERADADTRGVSLVTVREGEAPSGRLDPVLLERAIANIVRNAVAVSGRGQQVVVTRSFARSQVTISVKDEGPGVPDEIRSVIFDAFVTHHVPKSGKSFGVGLGLALAREIARAHDGELTLADGVDKGALFVMTFPLMPSAATVRATHAS